MNTKTIGVIVGSLRRDSFSKQTAEAIAELMPDDFRMETLAIGDLPLYNQDFDDDGNPPDTYTAFRRKVQAMDGFLFVTPEYNRSLPAVIKNALDVASRPYGQNMWSGKPAAIASVSPGKLGAFGANHHLRQSMVFLNVCMMQQPEAYIGNVDAMFDAAGKPNDAARAFLTDFATAFADWVRLVTK